MKPTPPALLAAAVTAAVAAFIPAAKRAEAAQPPKSASTYARDVAPILYGKCASCHHPGEVAPFSLMSYEDARGKAKTIAAVAAKRFMPPWQAVSHGEFANDRTLSASQIKTLQAWADAGAPSGDLSTAPPPPVFASGWQIGQPDFVGKPAKAYNVPAEGADEYRCFVIPTKTARTCARSGSGQQPTSPAARRFSSPKSPTTRSDVS